MKDLGVKFIIYLVVLSALIMPLTAFAKDTYPKLANYYLKYFDLIKSDDYEQLMKWDLLILPNEVSMSNANFLNRYKAARSSNLVLAYIYPAMSLTLSHTLYNKINAENLWLRDGSGNMLQIWSGLYATNLTKPAWQNMNLDFVVDKMNQAAWDGIMYDTVDTNIDRYSRNGIDINGDGQADSSSVYNAAWQKAMADLFSKTRQRLGSKIIVINGQSDDIYQHNVNGRIFEMFPTPWEGNGSWQASMYQYLRRLPPKNKQPNIYVINGSTNNTGRMDDYRKVRFGLASTLLGDGYFSFDYGDQRHEQLWWYDEYNLNLGRAESSYYNLLAPTDDYVRAGLWRRDFENGVAIVNSTNKNQLYIFKQEQFEKIFGTQDRNTNDGSKVNYVRLAPNDGIIMRRVKQDITGAVFVNGNFIRVFNSQGKQERNGFFAYRGDLKANALVLLDDLDNDGKMDRLSEQNGTLVLARGGKSAVRISPYGANFKGALSFAAYDFNKDGFKEIVLAPQSGGGPHVKIYSSTGRLLNPGFFAYDKNFRGGVNISLGDVNNDGRGEIVIGAGKGLPPTVKIFTEQGKPLGSFLAYDKNFRGGVNVAVGDVNNNGQNLLVTGAASGGPHIRLFDYTGRLTGQFMAYDTTTGSGVSVMVADTNGDGLKEILAGTTSF